MSESPIIFSGPMVKAILEGKKTQTRRLIGQGHRESPHRPGEVFFDTNTFLGGFAPDDPILLGSCPYGVPGDRLWVRETWRRGDDGFEYLADEKISQLNERLYDEDIRWLSPIFIPRKASRITLEIERVKVERLQEITEEDAKAEGVTPYHRPTSAPDEPAQNGYTETYRAAFLKGWDQINGKKAPWASNPWVWVVSFKVVHP